MIYFASLSFAVFNLQACSVGKRIVSCVFASYRIDLWCSALDHDRFMRNSAGLVVEATNSWLRSVASDTLYVVMICVPVTRYGR